MAMVSEDRIRLLDMADSIREIQSYIGRDDFAEFSISDNERQAVIEQLVMIGGASAMLSDEFREKYGEIDWDMLKGLQYANFDETLELDLHPLWRIAQEDLPDIMNQILDLAAVVEGEEDLSDVTLNEEDLKDNQSIQEEITSRINVDKNVRLEDESFNPPLEKDMIVQKIRPRKIGSNRDSLKMPGHMKKKEAKKVSSEPSSSFEHHEEEHLPFGAGIANEEARRNVETIHKGSKGTIDDNEIENTDLKGFDRSDD